MNALAADAGASARRALPSASQARVAGFVRLEVIALIILGVMVAVGNHVQMPYLLGGIGLLTVIHNAAPAPALDPLELSSTVFLAIVVAIPFGKLPHSRLTLVLAVVTLIAVAGSAICRPPWQRSTAGSLLVLALFGVLAVSTELAPDSGGAKRLAVIGVAAVPAFYLGARLSHRQLTVVARVLVALAAAEALIAIAEPFVLSNPLWIAAGDTGTTGATQSFKSPFFSSVARSQGTFGHPLPLGVLLVVGIGLLIRVIDGQRRWRWGLTTLLFVGLVFTADRSCLLAAVALLLLGDRARFRRLASLAAAALAATLLLIDTGTLKGSILTNFSASGSYLHRASAYSLSWRLFNAQGAASAFGGNGFGSTQRLFDAGLLQTDGFKVVDNQFVLVQAQGGMICLALLITLSVLAIVYARRALRPVVVFLVGVSLIFDWLSWPSSSALVFLFFGVAFAGRTAYRPSEQGHTAVPSS